MLRGSFAKSAYVLDRSRILFDHWIGLSILYGDLFWSRCVGRLGHIEKVGGTCAHIWRFRLSGRPAPSLPTHCGADMVQIRCRSGADRDQIQTDTSQT